MDINNNNINNETDNDGDNRGKFSDRLKKIRKDKALYKKGVSLEKEEPKLKTGARNLLKIALALPSVVYTHVKSNNVDDIEDLSYELDENGNLLLTDNYEDVEVRKIKVNKIREMNVASLKAKKKVYLNKKRNYIVSKIVPSKHKEKEQILNNTLEEAKQKTNKRKLNENELKVEALQKDIINLIKKRLVKNLNELEVLRSELYVLSELTGERIHLVQCEEDIKEIKKLLSKIKSLKEKYDYLKDNIDFEYMLEHGEDFLVDKILELKELYSLDDVRYTVDNYKLLEEFKRLYLKVDKISEDAINLENQKKNEIEALKERNIDFEKFKNEIYNVDRENNRYMNFVEEQEDFLKSLEDKISKIDSHEEVIYRIKGFNQFLNNSFLYLGLLLTSPLKGLIPGIATQTLITGNIVRNLYRNLSLERDNIMVYEAIDYSNSISRAINDLDYTSLLINSTLEDIIRLKEKYKSQFGRYDSEISQYKDAIKKLNKIENAILGNKLKIDLVKTKLKEKEKENSKKMNKVRRLNHQSRSS